MIVCVVCDEPKPTAELVGKPSMCTGCQRVTGNRAVAGDSQVIAPGSYVTFGTQRAWYKTDQGGNDGEAM